MYIDGEFKKAALSQGRKLHPWLNAPIFALVFTIAEDLMALVLAGPLIYWMLTVYDLPGRIMSMDMLNMTADTVRDLTAEIMNSLPDWLMLVMLFATVFELAVPVFYCRVIEKRPLCSMGMTKKGAVRSYLTGYLIGAAMIGAVVGISVLFGQSRVGFSGLTGGALLTIGLYFLGYLIQGAAEEFLCRGYLMISLYRSFNRKEEKKYAAPLAVIISSLVFSLLHVMNPGFTPLAFLNTALFGALAGVYVFRTGSIWGACGIHAAWNFFLGNVFGVSVSGTGVAASVFRTESAASALSGGQYGFEGGWFDFAVTAFVLGLVLFLPRVFKKQNGAAPDEPYGGGWSEEQ